MRNQNIMRRKISKKLQNIKYTMGIISDHSEEDK